MYNPVVSPTTHIDKPALFIIEWYTSTFHFVTSLLSSANYPDVGNSSYAMPLT